MRVLFLNHTYGVGSTGRICADLAKQYMDKGYEVRVAYSRGEVPERFRGIEKQFGGQLGILNHALGTRITDRHGFFSKHATRQLLKWADEYNPDILWLHNIHGYYINIEMLFEWIKSRPDMEVKWTLHDCWAFTGHCSYFTMVGCDKWKKHCENCPQKSEYPGSLVIDNSRQNYDRKKAAFTGVKNMTLITPSQWLKDLVKQSFLKEYPVEVHYNTIDTKVFKPTPSDFREKHGLKNKKIVLGVANIWSERKGLKDFIKLSEMLDENYAIVLVGLNEKQIKNFNSQTYDSVEADKDKYEERAKTKGGIAIPQSVNCLYKAITGKQYLKDNKNGKCSLVLLTRTNSVQELAEIYTAADVFCNPTYEDNYPTTNLEAQACGTRVVTYDTGGSKETLK